jgi:hypothetical protein
MRPNLFGRIDESEARHFLNPSAMRALAILEEFENNVMLARTFVGIKARYEECPKQWMAIYAVLNGETGGNA